ncbi:23S rRNA (guanosine2251-2'-O)-methyltransferase [Catalinimonas alkaloidigena]|uniref:23S rRNA (Guanosine2251-2'-O)-methyltransferase n=1 Tax=Catalinimonas alkaloidigena TaxID=1075417 RepID=A0A1G8XRS2_9BACT|nr:23S rRNA (guanosine(2251)-2'-O)-methyltransferase RlmB [Catalinimonas alkaloidigena]SDJ93157.1 23S rRNA (guanosine2251-2'-O)-methyltransferase [Catalinimonas alkaloidigena]
MEKRNRPKIRPTAPEASPVGRDVVFGLRAVVEVLRSDQEVERILVQKDLKNEVALPEVLVLARERHVPVQRVPIEKLNRVTRKNHQGVIALISSIAYASLENVIDAAYEAGHDPLMLILDRVTDVRNFGAIARSAECAGVDALVLPERGGARIGSDALKTSAGALSHLPVCRVPRLAQTIRELQARGVRVVACTEKADKLLYEVDLSGPLALLLGSEEDGIQPELLEKSDEQVRLPIQGKVSSLNVSVAAGIATYEAVRQRLNTVVP